MDTATIYMLAFLIAVPLLILILAMMYTPMGVFLKAKLRRTPVYFDAENRKYVTPIKREKGMEIFKIGRERIIVPANLKATEKTKYGEFGLLYPSHCVTIHPKALQIAEQLKKEGYKDLTEAQVALALHYLKKEYPEVDPTNPKQYVEVTDSFGRTHVVSGMEFVLQEMEEMGVYPFAITAKEIKNILSSGKHDRVAELERPIAQMIDYVGIETRPASIANYVNEMVLAAKEETMLGRMKSVFIQYGWLVGVIMAIAIFFYLLQKGGGIDALIGSEPTKIRI